MIRRFVYKHIAASTPLIVLSFMRSLLPNNLLFLFIYYFLFCQIGPIESSTAVVLLTTVGEPKQCGELTYRIYIYIYFAFVYLAHELTPSNRLAPVVRCPPNVLGLAINPVFYPKTVESSGELGFTMVFQSKTTPFKRWVEPERVEKFVNFFGPGVDAEVIKCFFLYLVLVIFFI